MSIQSEITRISGNVSDAFTAIAAKGGTVPTGANSDDLAAAIATISGGGGLPDEIIDITNTGTVMSDADTPPGDYNYRMYAYVTNPSAIYAFKSVKPEPAAQGVMGQTYISFQYELPSTITTPNNAYIVIVMNDSLATECRVGYFTNSPLEELEEATSYNALGAHMSEANTTSGGYPEGQPIVHFYDGSKGSLNYIMIETWAGTVMTHPTTMPSVYVIPTTKSPFYESITRSITTNTTTSITPSANYYDMINSVSITTSIPPTEPTIDLVKYTGGAVTSSTGGNVAISVSSVIPNTTTPFTLILIGGKTTNTSTAGAVTKLHYNGSTFSVTYDSSGNCPTVTTSGCNINASRSVNIKFSTYWYPHGASNSTSAQYYMPVIH